MFSLSTQNAIYARSTTCILPLDPFLDKEGLIRVCGRLSQKHPITLPAKYHFFKVLIRHLHERVHHQGRHLTQSAVRKGGLWIICLKRTVFSVFNPNPNPNPIPLCLV